MGTELSMWQVTPDKLDQLLDSEDTVEAFINSCFSEALEDDADEYEDLNLDKIWHLLHYLIIGDAENEDYPLAHAIMVGHLLHESRNDLIYSLPDEVKDISRALSTLSKKDLWKNCDPKLTTKAEIYRYPKGVDEHEFDEAMKDFRRLKRFYNNAAEKGNSILRFFH